MLAARMALAAKYQDKFVQAHEALIGVSSKLTEPRIRELLAGAGIDMDRLNRDLATNAKGDRRHPRAQPRAGGAFDFKGHAVLHRRQIPRSRRPDHGAVRDASSPTRARRRKSLATQNAKAPPATRAPFAVVRISPELLRRNLDPVFMGARLQRVPVGRRDVPVDDGAVGRGRPGRSPRSTSARNRRYRRRPPAAAHPKSFRQTLHGNPPMSTTTTPSRAADGSNVWPANAQMNPGRPLRSQRSFAVQPVQDRRVHLARIGVAEIVESRDR